jgi:hypothetical protein
MHNLSFLFHMHMLLVADSSMIIILQGLQLTLLASFMASTTQYRMKCDVSQVLAAK